MRTVIIVLLLLLYNTGFAQCLDSIKHIEVVSEIRDTMALLNKDDVDIINRVFHDYRKLDSLDKINAQIIETLEIKNNTLELILSEQKAVVQNQNTIINKTRTNLESTITHYEQALYKERIKKACWQSTTAASIIAIIVVLLI